MGRVILEDLESPGFDQYATDGSWQTTRLVNGVGRGNVHTKDKHQSRQQMNQLLHG